MKRSKLYITIGFAILVSCSQFFLSCKKKNVSIIPYYAVYGDTGVNSFISAGLEKNQPDFSDKLDTFKVANYIFEGDLELDITTIKQHILNFLDTAKLSYINSNSFCQIRFYKTSSVTNRNFRDYGIDGYIPADDFIGEIFFNKGKPHFLEISINGSMVAMYEFNTNAAKTNRLIELDFKK